MQNSLCNAFEKKPDGSWVSIKAISILDDDGDEIKVSEGIVFSKGTLLMSIDWAKWLNEQCV